MLDPDRLPTDLLSARRHRIGDLLARSGKRVPGRTALVYKQLRLTFRELDELVNRTANAMAARGIGRSDHIALLSHNNHAFVVLRFALARLGAVMVPINFMLNASEIAYILDHAEVSAMIAEDSLVNVAEAAITSSSRVIGVRAFIREHGAAVPDNWEPVLDWMSHPDSTMPDLIISDDEPTQILYTSGTESRPKGAMLSGRNLYAHYTSCIIDGGMSGEDIEVHAMPLFHCAQLDCFLTPDLLLGATSIVLPRPDADMILTAIDAEHVTKLFCPPTVWIALLRHPDFERRDLSSLRKGYYGASIMPVEIIKEIDRRLPGIQLYNFYGQTEMSPMATVLQPQDQLRKLGSAGRAAINVETRVVDDDDQPVGPDVVGEIVHRGPHVMLGYWKDPERSSETVRGGWLHSGDLGRIDDEGYLFVVDRKKDMIKTGGENVASREVEEVLFQHPSVAEAAVFGVPHPRWIEAVTAVVVIRPGEIASADELAAFCRARLAGYKVPKYIMLTDSLPKTASGKILKRELRLLYADVANA